MISEAFTDIPGGDGLFTKQAGGVKGREPALMRRRVRNWPMAIRAIHEHNKDQVDYWNGPSGHRWAQKQETQDILLAPISNLLFDRTHIVAGENVLDVGCGCGGTSVEIAHRVGATGYVLGIDISTTMLERARERISPGMNVEFADADATVHQFESGKFDLLFSRFGVMFFADPALSFSNMRRAIRPRGRVVFACWREPRANAWIAEPLRAACKHVPRLPDTDPDAPGPFAFANDARVKGILTEAGFSSIAMERCDLSLDVALGRGLEFAVKGMFEIGPVSRALQGQPDETLSAVAESIRAVLAPRERDGSILLDASVWIVTAANPG